MTVAMVAFLILLGAFFHKAVKGAATLVAGAIACAAVALVIVFVWLGIQAVSMFEAFVLFSWQLGRKSA